jgi:uncharacterized membrane protein
MKVPIVLLAVFGVFIMVSKRITGFWDFSFGGNLAMCVMLCFTAMGHFLFRKGMVMMMPPMIPYKAELVYATAILEVLLGFALLSTSTRIYAGVTLIVFFLALLPANVYGAMRHVNLEKATYEGLGPAYLWFRVPLQLFLIGWVYYFSVS